MASANYGGGGRGGGDKSITRWYREDDGTWSKIKTTHDASHKIKAVRVLEDNVSDKEYFKRSLGNSL